VKESTETDAEMIYIPFVEVNYFEIKYVFDWKRGTK
jgi:hypothetical protein